MVTKGIIKSIDLLGNTCTVHIPFFETAGNDPIIETATISNTPGIYNGYKVGDAVYVAFEDGRMDTPVVIGKLYLGTEKEKADPRGVSNVEESSTAKKATLPADSKLTVEIDANVPNTTTPYNSLSSIANGLNTLNTDVGQMDRDYGNKFKQVIATTNGMQSTIEQNSDSIKNSVLHKRSEGGEEQDLGNGLTTKGLGWHLDTDKWVIKAYDQQKNADNQDMLPSDGLEIFKIDRTTVEINAPNVKLAGYPRATTVRYAYSDSNKNYPSLDTSVWTETTLDPEDNRYIWQWTQTIKYDYDEKIGRWNDVSIDKVLCVTGPQGDPGNPGVSIISQTTYYTLIAPVYETGEIAAPISDNNLTVMTTGGNLLTEEHSSTLWSTTPPEHTTITLQDGWKYWTTTRTEKSNGEISYSNPIISEDTSGAYAVAQEAYALAQGKTTNYYSVDDPTETYVVKKGDCWFQTVSSEDENYNKEITENQGKLYQWNGEFWEDIGGELVANKLTANYINALDITAKKVTIINNSNNEVLFEANGISGENNYVKIAGFDVKENTLTTGTAEEGNLIKLNSDNSNSDSSSQCSFSILKAENYSEEINGYQNSFNIKAFEKATNLWQYNNRYYLAFSAANSDLISTAYSITKVTFTRDLEDPFIFYIRDTSTQNGDIVIVSKLSTDPSIAPKLKVPTGVDNYAVASTDGKGVNDLVEVTFNSIEAGTYFYIVYKHSSSSPNSEYKGQVYLPVDIRMSIGDNFQILADGSVYANNLFLGGIDNENSESPDQDTLLQNSEEASGQLTAMKGQFDKVEARNIEIKDLNNTIVFKANGSNPTNPFVQLGGWIVEKDDAIPQHGWIFRSKTAVNNPVLNYYLACDLSDESPEEGQETDVSHIGNGNDLSENAIHFFEPIGYTDQIYYQNALSNLDELLFSSYKPICVTEKDVSLSEADVLYPFGNSDITHSSGAYLKGLFKCADITPENEYYEYYFYDNNSDTTTKLLGKMYFPNPTVPVYKTYRVEDEQESSTTTYRYKIRTTISTLAFNTYYLFFYTCNEGNRFRFCYSDNFTDIANLSASFCIGFNHKFRPLSEADNSTNYTRSKVLTQMDNLSGKGFLDFDIGMLPKFIPVLPEVTEHTETDGDTLYSEQW